MKLKKTMTLGLITFLGVLFTIACGGSNVTLSELPVFPGAKELKAGESKMGDTLKNNMATDKKLRESMGPLAAKGSIEQMGFSLASKTTWKEVKGYYDQKLKAQGWESGLGGIAGKFVDVNKAVNTGNNKMAKTIIYSKGSQNLTILMLTTPNKKLILSLSST